MKKQLLTILGVAAIAAPAFASKARLQALGEDIYGSSYINDNRNIFLNAANVNNYKNLLTLEWGNTSSNSDAVATPRADGGAFMTAGNLVYGVYLGDETNDSNLMRRAGGLSEDNSKEENNVGVFLGGEAGLKWGASLVYSKSANSEAAATAQSEQQAMRARLGVILNNGTEVFSSINLKNTARTTDVANGDFKGKLGYRVGAIHNIDNVRVFATWSSLTGENLNTDNSQKINILDIGAGRSEKLNDKVTLFTKIAFNKISTENNDSTGAFTGAGAALCNGTISAGGSAASILACEEYKKNSLPVVVGMEYSAASWLALRGSISQAIWSEEIDTNDDKRTAASTTIVNAGASLLFGDMTVDGVIGNNNDGATVGNNGTSTGAGQIRTDSLMSRVSMTYRF